MKCTVYTACHYYIVAVMPDPLVAVSSFSSVFFVPFCFILFCSVNEIQSSQLLPAALLWLCFTSDTDVFCHNLLVDIGSFLYVHRTVSGKKKHFEITIRPLCRKHVEKVVELGLDDWHGHVGLGMVRCSYGAARCWKTGRWRANDVLTSGQTQHGINP